MPARAESAGLIVGLVSSAGSLIGAKGETGIEHRPLMQELVAQGRLTLFPWPEGRLRISLTGLELTALRGPAASSGVSIIDGVLDAGIDMRSTGAYAFDTDATLIFQHLALEESSDGPISTYLRLPAPTNTVIFVLKTTRTRSSCR